MSLRLLRTPIVWPSAAARYTSPPRAAERYQRGKREGCRAALTRRPMSECPATVGCSVAGHSYAARACCRRETTGQGEPCRDLFFASPVSLIMRSRYSTFL